MLLQFQPGDLAACYGGDLTSRVISWGTFSLWAPPRLRLPPSHVAIIVQDGNSAPLWVESTTLAPRPCRIRGCLTNGVQAHDPHLRIDDYISGGGRIDLYRLTPIDTLSNSETSLLSRILLDHFLRRRLPYDYRGAMLSGTRLFQSTRLFPGADLEQLFCSELIAAALMRLGRLNRTNPSRFHPGRLLRQLVRSGTYQLQASLPQAPTC